MRTITDFSKHQLEIIKEEHVLIHNFHIPGTIANSIKFINTSGILAVTGDYGNWIFCREFHPSKDGRVSDNYWLEKLSIASSQNPYEFDSEKAQQEIKDLLENKDHDFSEDEKEWLQNLSNAADEGEYEYISVVQDHPSSFETEMIPRGKIVKYWLLVIFDAFEEIVKILKTM